MRGYAESLQPPPVADVIARAEQTREAPHPPSTARLRSRGRLVLAIASVAATVAVVAIAADRLPDRGAPAATAATQPTASTAVARMAPGCPPGLPVLEGPPLAVDGKASKPLAVETGQQLTLTARIPASAPDRPLLSFTIYLMPPGEYIKGAVASERAKAVSHSPVVQLTPDQQRVSTVLQIPTGLAPGTYDVAGYATYPGPSLCGFPNPTDATEGGATYGTLGSVVIN
jgi:hypothetical protein